MRYSTADDAMRRSMDNRPFEIQLLARSGWGTIPGAYYETRETAEQEAAKLCADCKYRVRDVRKT